MSNRDHLRRGFVKDAAGRSDFIKRFSKYTKKKKQFLGHLYLNNILGHLYLNNDI